MEALWFVAGAFVGGFVGTGFGLLTARRRVTVEPWNWPSRN